MLVCVAIIDGCNTTGCLENRNSVPLAGFYSSSDYKPISLNAIEITGLGIADDKPLSESGKSISSIYLPMRSTQQSTAWVFSYKQDDLDDPMFNDTIKFEYDSTPFFASEECGIIFKYAITRLDYTTHLIDSIGIADSLITNIDVEQIKIFFRTSKEEEAD